MAKVTSVTGNLTFQMAMHMRLSRRREYVDASQLEFTTGVARDSWF